MLDFLLGLLLFLLVLWFTLNAIFPYAVIFQCVEHKVFQDAYFM